MGEQWWEDRRRDFKEARELLRRRQDLVNTAPENVFKVDWQDPDNVLSFRDAVVVDDRD